MITDHRSTTYDNSSRAFAPARTGATSTAPPTPLSRPWRSFRSNDRAYKAQMRSVTVSPPPRLAELPPFILDFRSSGLSSSSLETQDGIRPAVWVLAAPAGSPAVSRATSHTSRVGTWTS